MRTDATQDATTPHAILRRSEVAALLGVSIKTLVRSAARGEFPAPIKISERRVGWLKSEVEAWFAAKQARDEPATADAPCDWDDDDELQF